MKLKSHKRVGLGVYIYIYICTYVYGHYRDYSGVYGENGKGNGNFTIILGYMLGGGNIGSIWVKVVVIGLKVVDVGAFCFLVFLNGPVQ